MKLENIKFDAESAAPYSDIVVVEEKFLFLSGLIAQDLASGKERYGSVTEETRLILRNLAKILKAYGSDMEHVVRTDVLLSDFTLRDEMNAEYIQHFKPGYLPSRICFGNVGLHGQCKVEIAVIATRC